MANSDVTRLGKVWRLLVRNPHVHLARWHLIPSGDQRGGIDTPQIEDILESALYVSDVARSVPFYQETFGFSVISEFGERGCAMHAGANQVLLLFKKGASRTISSPHDEEGELHPAFAIRTAELANWLQTKGVAVEGKSMLEAGGWSLYFRDPDRHLMELATPGTWSVY